MDWREYQREVAAFFRSLGFEAEVDAAVQGARAKHKVDVWAVSTPYGFPIRWAVECKLWNRNIPKEKVLTHQKLIEDVGADRGFIVSEIGFQRGAHDAAKGSNTRLCSLDQLQKEARDFLIEAALVRLGTRATQTAMRLHALWETEHLRPGSWIARPKPGVWDHPSHLRKVGVCGAVEGGIRRAQAGLFPAIAGIGTDENPVLARDAESFVPTATATLDDLEKWLRDQEQVIEAVIEPDAG